MRRLRWVVPSLFVSSLLLAQPRVATHAEATPQPVPAPCERTTRWDLSPIAGEVLSRIETNAASIAGSTVPLKRLFSACNRLDSVHVDGPQIFGAARDMLAAANEEVNLAFFKWEHDSYATQLIGDGLIAAQARRSATDPLLVRIVIDDVEEASVGRPINHLWSSQKAWINRGLDTSRVRLQFATAPRFIEAAGALHDKIIVADGRKVLVTGAQPQKYHDPYGWSEDSGWHDSAYVFSGDGALSALAAFDYTWNHPETFHWQCSTQSFSFDCEKRTSHFPNSIRTWLPVFGSQQPGHVPLIAVSKEKDSSFSNSTHSPQDIAWLTLMERATSHIHVETPNINDDAFRASVVSAVGRGVPVRLLTSLGFNDATEDLPSLGGDNQEVVGRLRKEIRSSFPWAQHLLQVRWYSRHGQVPVGGNGAGASHTKYMTVDDQVAVVGSGNQDTPSWNVSQEFNFLVDDPAAVGVMEGTVFLPDWNKAITSYLEFYEGNDGTEDVVCPFGVVKNQSMKFSDPITWTDWDTYRCNNDEARSVLLHDVPAGKVFRLYDDPEWNHREDDWTEIRVKRFVSRKYLASFQQTFEDADVRVIHHRDNDLDGKVSSMIVGTTPTGPVVDLYEGNGGSQNLVCSNVISGTQTLTPDNSGCNNDEARSLILYDFPADKVIYLYDDPGGSRGDDWTLIVPKRTISRLVIPSFESSYENDDVRVCAYSHNGLDGKVSRTRIASRTDAAGYCGIPIPVLMTGAKSYAASPAPSSSYPDAGGELTNGVISTGSSWANAAGWLYTNPTITVDLGGVSSLAEVQLFVGNSFGNGGSGVGRPASVAVSISSDGSSFSHAGYLTFDSYSSVGTKDQVDLGTLDLYASARWIRFSIAAASPWVMVTELAVRGTPGPGVIPSNAYTVSPAASAQYYDQGGELRNGVLAAGLNWVEAVGWYESNPAITLDLGSAFPLTQLELFVCNSHNNGSYGVALPSAIQVLVSNNGYTFTPAGSMSTSPHIGVGSKEQVNRGVLPLATTARWIRVAITRGGPWTLVTEVKVTTAQ